MKAPATILALLFLLLPLPMPVFAQEATDEAVEDADPEVEAIDDEKAEALLVALKRAEKTRDEKVLLMALEFLVVTRNEKLVKPLGKLAAHKFMRVRILAVKALGSQKEPVKKVGPMIWKVYQSRQNKKLDKVRAAAVSAMRRVKFDNKMVMKELEGEFKKVTSTLVMKECVRYFGDLKKAEMVKWLINWIEAPQPASVNSPSNPPAAYWERMWKIWEEIKEPVRTALINITGQDYPTKRQWRVWLESDEARRIGAD